MIVLILRLCQIQFNYLNQSEIYDISLNESLRDLVII